MEDVMERPMQKTEDDFLVSLVPQEHLVATWPAIRPYLQKSADMTYGRFEVDDILVMMLDRQATCWVAFEAATKEIVGVVVSKIVAYPRRRMLDMTFIGGKAGTGRAWKDRMLKVLRLWARDNQCDGIESLGRAGWARALKQDGYTVQLHFYELPLEEDGDVDG